MFYELVATLVAGVAAAGIVLLINKLTKGRLPGWMMPLAAAAAMVGVSIANEYAWYGRNTVNLPDGFVVAQTVEKSSLYRPWTKIAPYIERFVAVDTQQIKTHAKAPNLRMVDTYLFGRWAAPNRLTVLADCAGMRRAGLFDSVDFGSDGSVAGAGWVSVGVEDPLLGVICSAEVPQ